MLGFYLIFQIFAILCASLAYFHIRYREFVQSFSPSVASNTTLLLCLWSIIYIFIQIYITLTTIYFPSPRTRRSIHEAFVCLAALPKGKENIFHKIWDILLLRDSQSFVAARNGVKFTCYHPCLVRRPAAQPPSRSSGLYQQKKSKIWELTRTLKLQLMQPH